MRCKACDCILGDHGDPEMCDECLDTIRPDFELKPVINEPTDVELEDYDDSDL